MRGLGLHLRRLEAGAVELFGEAVGEERLRALMRRAVEGREACWLRVSLFSPQISHRDASWRGRPRVMTAVFDPPTPLAGGVRLQPQVHARETPHIKHVATFGLMRARRAAREAGFDDALFVDDADRVAEGTLWNIGFVRGERVIWPRAPMLAGVTQALIERRLGEVGLVGETAPVTLDDLAGFDAAFLCNSATPAAEIAAVGERAFPGAAAVVARVAEAWRRNTVEGI